MKKPSQLFNEETKDNREWLVNAIKLRIATMRRFVTNVDTLSNCEVPIVDTDFIEIADPESIAKLIVDLLEDLPKKKECQCDEE